MVVCSMLGGNWMRGEFGRRMDTCICMAEPPHYSSKTIITNIVNQLCSNRKLKVKSKK